MGSFQTSTLNPDQHHLPLSLSQREVWLDQRAWPGSTHLNIGGGAFLLGRLDLPRFQHALRLLVAQHDALRLAPLADGTQHLLPYFEPRLEVVNLNLGPQALSEADAKAAMRRWWDARIKEPFVLNGQPPWRFALLRASDDLHGLTIQFHHLVMDGWGTTQIMRAWSELYQGLADAPTSDFCSDLGSDTDPELHRLLPPPTLSGGTQAPAESAAGVNSPIISYTSFIDESRQYQSSALFERDAAYWLQHLGALPKPLISTRRSRNQDGPAAEGPERPKALPPAHVINQGLAHADYAALTRAALILGATPFTCFLAALALYFSRVQERQSVLIGVPSLNRSGRKYRQTPGMFVGILAIKIEVFPQATAAELLAQVSQQMQGALRHPRYPLSDLCHRLQLMREGRDNLVDVLLSFERQDYDLHFGAAHLQDSRQLFSGCARYPLAVTVCEFDNAAHAEMVLEASSDCFSAAESAMLGRRIWHLAQALVQEPRDTLQQFEVVPPEERWALLEGLHQNLAQLDTPQPYIDLFEHQAALRPEACALIWDEGAHTVQMSYSALARRVETLAGQLRQLGATRNKVVALALERSPEMVVALLAINRAGAAFLPLDPLLPHARLAGILFDSEAVALLVDSSMPAGLPDLHSRCLRVPKVGDTRPGEPASNNALKNTLEPGALDAVHSESLWTWAKARPEDLAYVLFTSGSTGRPKGVMIDHDTLSRRLAWLSRAWGISAADRSAQGTQLGFDPSLIELLLPLTQGASIALPPAGRLLPQRLAEFILKHGATFSAFVPTTLPGLLAGWRNKTDTLKLRVACCGGEVLPPELAQRFVTETGVQLYNVYGPTETAIFATAWPCAPLALGNMAEELQNDGLAELPVGLPNELPLELPIGRPIDDTRIYVLDLAMQPQPFGVTGDIYIGGKAIARGYLGRPDLNAQAYLPDPFVQGQRIYRSGDRGWLDPLGQLHFTGRRDRQVKLRGYRIELGDVEAACLAIPGLKQAVVQIVEIDGKSLLHAWVAAEAPLGLSDIQAGLRARLPDYMRPTSYTLMPELPLTANGKIDHAGLPRPQANNTKPDAAVTQAANALEQALLEQWQLALKPAAGQPISNLLGDEATEAVSIGVHDNFFDLGGDSLAALSILDAMEQRLGRRLPLQLISENPTIAQLALALARPLARPGIIRVMSEHPGAVPLYLASSGHGDVMRLQNLAHALKSDASLYMLQAPLDPAPGTMQEFATLYADSILAQNNAPGWLAGFSVGGVTAIETALELKRRGHPVRGLILLDTIHPDAMFGGAASWRTLGWLVQKLHVQELSMNGRRLGAMFSDPGLISQVLALRGYHCPRFEGPVLLIKSTGLASWNRLLFKPWQRAMPKTLLTREVSGLHGSIFEAQHVGRLADELRAFLHSHADETESTPWPAQDSTAPAFMVQTPASTQQPQPSVPR
ncbi:non-ribosomal peptide synthetase [Roseateles koreensis]|uniref:Amino acid adenylation domain-containing protein n=1 Tax=Roseateles koreensis TaxID=2987526 RepID=A0ABT5KSW7_9BURK|nr:amino acid adenylation domain-containing protein [Roseateles koreensis]MDC8786014.1 amino acid adenylation domain-containing protein [Roseateles koreensis]